MHCHCGTNYRAPRWTFTDPCKPEVRPGAREESASPAWLAAPAMNARDTKKVYIWRLDTGCGPTLYRKCHSHNTPGKRHNNTWVEPLAGNCTTTYSVYSYTPGMGVHIDIHMYSVRANCQKSLNFNLFMPPTWKVRWGHLVIGWSFCQSVGLSICLSLILSCLQTKCNI